MEARVVGVGSYISPHLMNQLTFRVTVGIEPEVSQGALGRGGGRDMGSPIVGLLLFLRSYCFNNEMIV